MSKFSLAKASSGKRGQSNPEEPRAKIVKLNHLVRGPQLVVPSADVLQKLGAAKLVIGIDLETNNFQKRSNPKRTGQFGHKCRLHDDDLKQRIVQIGWATGSVLAERPLDDSGTMLVKPIGFDISKKATNHHGITQDKALGEGLELRNALELFMDVVRNVVLKGGVVVAHNLEFDAGIIANELKNVGLDAWLDEWAGIAKNGVCTMEDDIMEWAISCVVGSIEIPTSDYGSHSNKLTFLGLVEAVKLFVPKTPEVIALLAKKGDAGADAQLHRVLYNTYRAFAKAAQLTVED